MEAVSPTKDLTEAGGLTSSDAVAMLTPAGRALLDVAALQPGAWRQARGHVPREHLHRAADLDVARERRTRRVASSP